MRLASLLLLAPFLAACASTEAGAGAPAAPSPLAASWHGTYGDGMCNPGEVVVFLEGSDATSYHGSMYFENTGDHARATYRVEAKLEEGVLSLVQREIEQADELDESTWCQGTYTLAVGPSQEAPALAGSYTAGNCGCAGAAKLSPYE